MKSYDNVIVGGGIAGLICGGYLAKAGQRTVVFESLDVAGGRITSHEFGNGYKCTLHGITVHPTMGGDGFWPVAAKELGAKVNVRMVSPAAAVWWRGKGWQYKYRAYRNVDEMIEFAGIQAREPLTEVSRREFARIFGEILRADSMRLCADLDRVFLVDWLKERTADPEVHHFFINLFAQMLCMDYADAAAHLSAGKCFTIYRQWLAREGPFAIPQDGTFLANFIGPFVEAFVKHGGELKCRSTVDEVVVRGGRATGVHVREAGGGDYPAKRVIVACPFPAIPRLFREVPPEVSESVAELEKVWMADVCVFSGLRKKVTDEVRWVAAQDPKDWRFLLGLNAYSASAPWAVPPGRHSMWTEKVYRWEDIKKKNIKDCCREANEITEEVFPGFLDAVEVQDHFVHPLLWHHQYSAHKKVPQRSTSLGDLYFIGDCTTPQYGTATDAVASSAMRVAKGILRGDEW